MPRPIATAARNLDQGVRKAPADKTNILKGVGGGRSDGMITANTPYLSYQVRTRRRCRSANLPFSSASPPLRPTAKSSAQPMTDPSVVKAASFSMLPGAFMEKVISNRSFTSGSDRKDESPMARTISPNGPNGRRTSFSHTETVSNNDIGLNLHVHRGLPHRGRQS